ncbi:MAG: hypothetical protein J6X44_03195, partial [Thermoguttaceae bacterium]|nr:hypothetical protein [Thermoguttaceae bacterium]
MSANFIQNEDEFSPDLIGVELYQGDNQNLMRVIEEYPEEIEKEGAVANAAEGNNVEALKILIERGFSIRPVRDSEGDFWYSPIGDAAGNLAFEALELLIAAGADVNETAKGRALPPLARAIRNANHANLAQTCK